MPRNAGQSARRIQAVDRAMNLLRLLAQEPEGVSLSGLGRRMELQPQTVQGLLRTLEAHGMVTQSGRGSPYRLGAGIQELANAWQRNRDRDALAREAVRALADRVRESVLLAELRDGALVSIMTAQANQTLSVNFEPETFAHPHAMATGKLLLAYSPNGDSHLLMPSKRHCPSQAVRGALIGDCPHLGKRTPHTITSRAVFRKHLAEIRQDGYAVSREESVLGVAALAVPVCDAEGAVTAALGVSIPAVRLDPAREQVLLRELRDTAESIEPWE